MDACWDLENTAVVLVGGMDISPFVPEARENPKAHIYLEGFKSEDEVKQYYQAADVFVLPTREDIWGLVVNEAMAVGLPVITTDYCGAGLELVEEGENGYLVPVEDAYQLKDKIELVLDKIELQKQICMKNLEKMNWYTIENMVQRHLEIFSNMKGKNN